MDQLNGSIAFDLKQHRKTEEEMVIQRDETRITLDGSFAIHCWNDVENGTTDGENNIQKL